MYVIVSTTTTLLMLLFLVVIIVVLFLNVPWVRQLVISLSLQRPSFDPRALHIGDPVALVQAFLWLLFCCHCYSTSTPYSFMYQLFYIILATGTIIKQHTNTILLLLLLLHLGTKIIHKHITKSFPILIPYATESEHCE